MLPGLVRKARDTLERGYRIESERYPILERRASEASVLFDLPLRK